MLSSVATRFYWTGRYLERAENTARLIMVYTNLLLDLPKDTGVSMRQLVRIAGVEEAFDAKRRWPPEHSAVRFMASDPDNPASILGCLALARENLRTLRDIAPHEAFEAVNELYMESKRRLGLAPTRKSRFNVLSRTIEQCQGVTGLFAGAMLYGPAYQFLRLGRNLERADMSTRILDVAGDLLVEGDSRVLSDHETILWVNVLRSLSAYQAYRQSVRTRITPVRVLHFVLNETLFPRSLKHCLGEIANAASTLPEGSEVVAVVRETEKRLDEVGLRDLLGADLHDHMDDFQVAIAGIHAAIDERWFSFDGTGPRLASE